MHSLIANVMLSWHRLITSLLHRRRRRRLLVNVGAVLRLKRVKGCEQGKKKDETAQTLVASATVENVAPAKKTYCLHHAAGQSRRLKTQEGRARLPQSSAAYLALTVYTDHQWSPTVFKCVTPKERRRKYSWMCMSLGRDQYLSQLVR